MYYANLQVDIQIEVYSYSKYEILKEIDTIIQPIYTCISESKSVANCQILNNRHSQDKNQFSTNGFNFNNRVLVLNCNYFCI